MAEPVVHHVAKAGFGKGTNELYDKARPSYQSNVLSFVRSTVESEDNLNVVEIGSGTGIFTRALLAHPEWKSSIAELKAVEPSEGMRDVFTKTVSDPRVSVSEGAFDKTGVPDGWADIITIAQAFHWCPNHETALKEFARILKPNGVVTLVWNMEDRERALWVHQLRYLYERYEQNTPQFRLGLWRAVFDEPSYPTLFQPAEEKEFSFTLPANLDIVTNRVLSKSYITVLPDEQKEDVKKSIKEIIHKGEDKVWIDQSEGVFEYPYQTFVVVLRRK